MLSVIFMLNVNGDYHFMLCVAFLIVMWSVIVLNVVLLSVIYFLVVFAKCIFYAVSVLSIIFMLSFAFLIVMQCNCSECCYAEGHLCFMSFS